jgi:hypothetical protein
MSDEPSDPSDKLPTAKEILAEVGAMSWSDVTSERKYLDKFRAKSTDTQESYAHLQGLRDHYKHKGKWSYFLMLVMAGMIIFQSALLGLVGAGIWDFSAYQWLLPALLVQNLAQIIGLAVFVVKALFKEVRRD